MTWPRWPWPTVAGFGVAGAAVVRITSTIRVRIGPRTGAEATRSPQVIDCANIAIIAGRACKCCAADHTETIDRLARFRNADGEIGGAGIDGSRVHLHIVGVAFYEAAHVQPGRLTGCKGPGG